MADPPVSQSASEDGDRAFVAALCEAVVADIDGLLKRTVDTIRAQLPEYTAVDLSDHMGMVRGQILGVLDALPNRELPGPGPVEHARSLGALRAQQGVSVEAVIGAGNLTCRAVWNALLDRAQAEDPVQAGRLTSVVNWLWMWLRAVTGAVVDGYAETARASEGARVTLEHQFLESLYGGRATAESTALAARAMNFDPHGTFQVICCPAESWRTQELDLLKRRLRAQLGTSITLVRGTALVTVFQGIPASQVLGLLGRGGAQVTAGVGLERPGLAGAAESIVDAERALALSRQRGGVADFGADWLAATMLPHLDRLQPLIDAGRAQKQSHLRDAVFSYSRHGFSITASAEALHIHPNTMKYRLDRWQQLTGWDPRTLDGLLRSLLSITFSPGDAQEDR
jgi:hypothetical protein